MDLFVDFINGFVVSFIVHFKVSVLGVDSLWGDCMFILADWGS